MLRWVDVGAYGALVALAILSSGRTPLQYFALGWSALFAVLWFVARHQLGGSFAVRPEARQLVTRGLYSKLRHPIYVFGTLAIMCASFALLGWGALVVWALVIPLEVLRARREERVLARAFGAVWEAYRASTWF